MKKIEKGILCLVFLLAGCFFSVININAEEEIIIQRGTCGASANWYRTLGGKVYVYGNGAIENNWVVTETDYDKIPDGAEPYIYPVREVIIQEGITEILQETFSCYGDNYKNIFHNQDDILSSSIEKITIPSSVTQIGNNAFLYDKNLKVVEIASNSKLHSINYSAFSSCSKLEKINLPGSLKEIENFAFADCEALEEIDIPELDKLGQQAFSGCGSLKSIKIFADVIGAYAFKECKSLEEAEIDSRCIEEYAFSECVKLKKVTLLKGVKQIKTMVFSFCKNLEEISIPETAWEFGSGIFTSCDNLKSVYFYGDCPFEPAKFTSESRYIVTDEVTGKGYYESTIYYFPDMFSGGIEGRVNETDKSIYFKDINLTLCPDGNGKYTYDNWSFDLWRSEEGAEEGTVWTVANLSEVNPTAVVVASNVSQIMTASAVTAYYPLGKDKWTNENMRRLSRSAQWKAWNPYGYKILTTAYISDLVNTKKGIKIIWNKVEDASGYYIYRRKKNGAWKKIKNIRNTTYVDKSVRKKRGEIYSYYVKPYAEKSLDQSKADVKSIARLLPDRIIKIKKEGQKIKINWKQNKKADGYLIQYASDSQFKKKKKVKIKKNTTTTHIKLKKLFRKKKKCFVRICAYKKWKGKIYYGTWSKMKKIRIR